MRGSVLIVDDDDDWRAVMADLLAEVGFVATVASDGRAALASWRRSSAQVVVTDVQMPGMDGRELLATLRSMDPSLPIIVLTAEDLSDAELTLPGAFRVIQKPASTDAVVSAVTEAFLRRRPARRRGMADAARAAISFGRAKGQAAMSRAASVLQPRRIVEPVVKRRRRGRAGLAVAAGFGAAAAAAVLVATIRSLAV